MTSLLERARATGHDAARTARNRALLERCSDAAERLLAAGAHDDAVAAVTLGAQLALPFHPGTHVAPRLERVLEQVAAARLEPLEERAPATPPRAVLHVVTETYGVGGHTRVLWRWIDRDRGRRHTVVTTAQRGEVPQGVADAAGRMGGRVVGLDPGAPALARAAEVRALAGDADVVVVHAHQHDPVPALALGAAGPGRPPVVVFDHGDHLLWLGAGVADAVYDVRAAGAGIARERRGIAAERVLLLPFPITGADEHVRRLSARQRRAARQELLGQLGWPHDTVLLLSVGAPYKFGGVPGATLAELVEPLLAAGSRARLLLLGPADAAHAQAVRRTDGRLRAFPAQPGIGSLFAAADVYLESRPLGGPGACAEAAAHGLPVLTTAAGELEAELFCTEPRYGATVVLGAEAYRERLAALIADPGERTALGTAALDAARRADEGFGAAVEQAYARAAELGPAGLAALRPPVAGAGAEGAPAAGDPLDLLVQFTATLHAPVDRAAGERVADAVVTAARSPAIRALWDRLEDAAAAAPARRYAVAFASLAGVDADALRDLVAELVLLDRIGAVESFALAVGPDEADAAIPVLEAALEAQPQLTVELAIEADPGAARPAGALRLTFDGDAGPDRHPVARAAQDGSDIRRS